MSDDDMVTVPREKLREVLADFYCSGFGHEHLGRPECKGAQAADRVIAALTAPPPPPSLREQVIEALDEAGYGLGSATVFDIVVPLVAAVLDAQPLVDDYAAAVARGGTAVGSRRIQRDHDVRWLLSQLPASTDPHAYVGHSDRVCDLCGLPDRHPRHAVYTVTNAGTP